MTRRDDGDQWFGEHDDELDEWGEGKPNAIDFAIGFVIGIGCVAVIYSALCLVGVIARQVFLAST